MTRSADGAGAAGAGVALPATSGARLLRAVACVTHCVVELEPCLAAWTRLLDYRLVTRGELAAATCAAWDTPAAAGRRYALLQPASGADCYLRFVETGERGHGPPATAGWTATELLVTDVDRLATELAGTGFRRLGGPGDLYPRPNAPRAMQVIGPSGELVYFTRLLPGGSRYGLKQAQSRVDRPFIVTVGGSDGPAMHRFYGETLGLRIMDRTPFRNGILAALCGVPPQTVFPTAVASIPGRRYLVEIDEFPPTVGPRPRRAGELPPGMALVSFIVPDLAAVAALSLRAPARPLAGPPYGGRRVAVIEGAAGEWLELIEELP
jgi:catechol 2,3-dioxygenase-like lactoylglutathione lyase family enzyme